MITLVCVLVASALTAGFVTLLRAGCGGDVYKIPVAVAGNAVGTLEDLAREWEAQDPEVDGSCVGVSIREVSAVAASRGLTGQWDEVSHGRAPIAWVPDSDVWPEWVTGTEATADYFSSDPVVLGESKTVLAVPEPTAEELGWLGGEPPSWSAVLDAALDGEVRLAGANPRSSTEGLQSLLNAVSDGAGGVDAGEMSRYVAALDAGVMGENAEELFALSLKADDPLAFADVFTALDYQVEDFNERAELDYRLVPITPAGADLNAVYPYVVFDGAGWVSDADERIAAMFGAFLQRSAARSAFEAAGISPVDAASLADSAITGETVRSVVRDWQGLRREVNLLIVVDRSSGVGGETVEYGGESVSASDAEIGVALDLVNELGSTSRAELWEFGVWAGGDVPYRSVVGPEQLSSEYRGALVDELWGLSGDVLYEGGSPLFDTVMAAYEHLGSSTVDGADNVIVVLTNDGTDSVSAPTIEQTEERLADLAGAQAVPVSVYTVGFGEVNEEYLQRIAGATQGGYVRAPDAGGLLESLRANPVN
ncbi:substrate-binding and VWA domain-containing protein [Glycomyces sp. L485]|uniref:vWA domain-containing protein n=1 Tax=Glycomyces sp. L485 TaxID=2909235 RepID=UPI001F4AD9E9|nr:substrate-binding domain-containing protein [Glycomyces sp. L485]MCH7230318.1 substrate-binding and VWA domain-containing protein [Glycomyces sp. L485]